MTRYSVAMEVCAFVCAFFCPISLFLSAKKIMKNNNIDELIPTDYFISKK